VTLRDWIGSDLDRLSTRVHDGVFGLVPAERWAEHADGGGSSLAFLVWHVARHHDLAVNAVVRGAPQVVERFDALARLGEPTLGLAEQEPAHLADRLDPPQLVAYFDAVGTATRRWLAEADLAVLTDVPDATGALGRAGVPEKELGWLHRMWADQPASYFVQWEAIGHGVNHLGEMVSIRNRMGLSPF